MQPYPPEERALLSRVYVAGPARNRHAPRPRLTRGSSSRTFSATQSEEFRDLWVGHEVGVRPTEVKRFLHPEVGMLELNCQTLLDPDQSHRLLVYTAEPGSESYEKLQLLSVIGAQSIS